MRRWLRLNQDDKLLYTLEDVAERVGLSYPSARVLCSRKVKSGELIRIRRNLYILPVTLKQYDEKDCFRLANLIQTPSYVSYTSALSFYGLTTQLAPHIVESTNPIRSCQYMLKNHRFKYFFCKQEYYFAYQKQEKYFIAEPEKALIDILYLLSLGRYALDEAALDLKGVRWSRVEKWLKKYPIRFRQYYKSWRLKIENLGKT